MTITLRQWVEQTKDRLEAVHKRSVEMLGEEMIRTKANGGRLPVDTGNLEKSQVASQEAMPKVAPAGTKFAGSNLGAVVATMDVSKPLYIGMTANYARRRNFGFVGADSLGRKYNDAGDHFVEGAAAEWTNIVNRAIAEVKSSSK